MSLSVASVTTPSSPSEPTNIPIRSNPVLFLWHRLPCGGLLPKPERLPTRARNAGSLHI